jgi:hypothetical protein
LAQEALLCVGLSLFYLSAKVRISFDPPSQTIETYLCRLAGRRPRIANP